MFLSTADTVTDLKDQSDVGLSHVMCKSHIYCHNEIINDGLSQSKGHNASLASMKHNFNSNGYEWFQEKAYVAE